MTCGLRNDDIETRAGVIRGRPETMLKTRNEVEDQK